MSGRALREMSLDELARLGEEDELGSVNHGRMMVELARRQTIAQLEATQAQKTASEAGEKAAKQSWTRRSTQSEVPTIFSGR
jgi:hypothetical protein